MTSKKPIKMPRGRVLMLRTCDAEMRAHGGFVWPREGLVEAPDWSERAECGFGLHGLLWGRGDYSLLSHDDKAVWLAVEIVRSEVVDLNGKVKVPRGWVRVAGTRAEAEAYIARRLPVSLRPKQASASGDYGQASASGYQGQASASGDYGQASASGDYGQASASGVRGQASASGVRGQASASGEKGEALAEIGGRACSGPNGLLLIWWHDGQRRRVAVGYVGEGGIKPLTWYRADERGALVEDGPWIAPKTEAA